MSAPTPDAIGTWLATAEKATPGPWEFYPGMHGDPLVAEAGRGPFGAVAMCSTGTTDYGRANAEFIAASRNAVETVRAEIDRLRAELAAAQEREARRLRDGALTTALVLRDVAGHLGCGEAVGLNGVWRDAREFRDHRRPRQQRLRAIYDLGRLTGAEDAVNALRHVASLNESAALADSAPSGKTP